MPPPLTVRSFTRKTAFGIDSLQAISMAIAEAEKAKDPAKVSDMKTLRASLLDQGSLKEAAAADRK